MTTNLLYGNTKARNRKPAAEPEPVEVEDYEDPFIDLDAQARRLNEQISKLRAKQQILENLEIREQLEKVEQAKS